MTIFDGFCHFRWNLTIFDLLIDIIIGFNQTLVHFNQNLLKIDWKSTLSFNQNSISTSNFKSDRIWTTKLLKSRFKLIMISFLCPNSLSLVFWVSEIQTSPVFGHIVCVQLLDSWVFIHCLKSGWRSVQNPDALPFYKGFIA